MVTVITGDPPKACLAIRSAVFAGNGREQELLEMIRTAVGTEMKTPLRDCPAGKKAAIEMQFCTCPAHRNWSVSSR